MAAGSPLNRRAEYDPAARDLLVNPGLSNTEVARVLDVNESSVRRWRLDHGIANQHAYIPERAGGSSVPETVIVRSGNFTPADRQHLHERLDAVLDSAGLAPEQVKGLRIAQWENVMRGTDGEPLITQLQGLKLDVKVNEIAPDWPLIDRPAVRLTVIPPGRPRPPHPKDKVAVILPDPQIGYRIFEDGTLDAFHDENAIDVAMQVTEDVSPDHVVCLGDFQDFAEFSRFSQERAFARTTQRGIDRGHEFVARLRQAAPEAVIDVMEGNHDRRAEKRITETNMAAWGLRRATDTTGWPVFSVPYLCAFDEYQVRYVGGYPAGEVWLTPEVRCIHGIKVRSGGSTAAAVVREEGVSTIFGHVHRIETQFISSRSHGGHRTRFAHTPGCLARIDGSVPSVKSSTTLDGRPVPSSENWQQGLSVVEWRDGRDSVALHSVFIDTANGHETRFNGKVYEPGEQRQA